MKDYIFKADIDSKDMRIDVFAARMLVQFSRSQIQKLIENGEVLVNDATVNKKYKMVVGDTVTISTASLAPVEILPEDIPLDVVFEDEYLAVINKPKGMVVHPATSNYSGTLVNALLYKYSRSGLSNINGDDLRPGIVHRLDKDTSGLLIVAKTNLAHIGLAEQIKQHSFLRRYEAIVCGHLKQQEGTLEFPIGRSPKDRKKMAVVYENCKEAKTNFRVISEFKGYSHIELELFTGRTHQIRVHMSHIGHQVAGDCVYGGKASNGLEGQCLHAKTIGFLHPITGENLYFTSELPKYFSDFLDKISAE